MAPGLGAPVPGPGAARRRRRARRARRARRRPTRSACSGCPTRRASAWCSSTGSGTPTSPSAPATRRSCVAARRLHAADQHVPVHDRDRDGHVRGRRCRRAARACSATPSATPRPASWATWSAGPACRPRAQWQRETTVFERLVAAGTSVTSIGPARFAGSGLTEAALRGPAYTAAESLAARVDATRRRAAAARAWRTCTGATSTRRATTTAGGPGSGATRSPSSTPSWAGSRGCCRADTVLVVTADHGMVDVDRSQRWDVGDRRRARRRRRAGRGGAARAAPAPRAPASDAGARGGPVAGRARRRGGRRDPRRGVADGWFGEVAEHVAARDRGRRGRDGGPRDRRRLARRRRRPRSTSSACTAR